MRQLKITNKFTIRENSVDKYFTEVNNVNLLSIEDEVELSSLAANGDQNAIDQLIKANLRFVISVAKQHQRPGLELIDLIQAGNEGIIVAAKRFDPTKGFKFISYAVWWIRQKIIEHIQSDRGIRLPANVTGKLYKLGREQEIAKQQLNNDKFENINFPNDYQVAHVSDYLSDSISTKDDSGTLEDVLPGEHNPTVNKSLLKEDLSKSLNNLINQKLDERESFIIRHKYGINCEPKLLERIGSELEMTKERARQIEQNALRKLRRHKHILKQLLN